MKYIIVLLIVVFLNGCAGMAQIGSIRNAYDKFHAGEFEEVIQLTSQAEYFQDPTHEMKAEIVYLRALTFEKMGRNEEAAGLFTYLSEDFHDTQYGYMATQKLN